MAKRSNKRTEEEKRTDEEKRAFGQWLLSKREEAGYRNQKEFAALLGISAVHLSRIETGVSGIGAATLNKAIEILGLDVMEAYRMAGLFPEASMPGKGTKKAAAVGSPESIKEILRRAGYFEGQGFSKTDIATITALIDAVDRVVARLREKRD